MIESENLAKNTSNKSENKRNPAEWISLTISAIIVSSIVGLIGYNWATKPNGDPVIGIKVDDKVRSENGQFYVPFKIDNKGGKTVELVQAIADLEINGKIEESGEQIIDFLSSGEEVEGAFVFKEDPRKGKLKLRIASYKLP